MHGLESLVGDNYQEVVHSDCNIAAVDALAVVVDHESLAEDILGAGFGCNIVDCVVAGPVVVDSAHVAVAVEPAVADNTAAGPVVAFAYSPPLDFSSFQQPATQPRVFSSLLLDVAYSAQFAAPIAVVFPRLGVCVALPSVVDALPLVFYAVLLVDVVFQPLLAFYVVPPQLVALGVVFLPLLVCDVALPLQLFASPFPSFVS